MSKKLVMAIFFALTLSLTGCGSNPEIGASCEEKDAGGQTSDGKEVMCLTGPTGELIWTHTGEGVFVQNYDNQNGGDIYTEGTDCEKMGAEGQTTDGVGLRCEENSEGKLKWVGVGAGSGQFQALISRAQWNFEQNKCPEAIADTGFERVIVDDGKYFQASAEDSDKIFNECRDAVNKGRTTNYSFSLDGVDYITQLEKLGAKVKTLNEHFSNKKCEQKEVQFKNSFTTKASDVKLLFPLGMVSLRHIIPTDHPYIQWNTMKPATNALISPADGYIVEIEGTKDDFRLIIELSCNFYVGYGHLDELAGPAKSQLVKNLSSEHKRTSVRVPVKAGDQVALAGEVMTDFWLWDQSSSLEKVRVANYLTHNGMNFYAVDPFKYLDDPVSKEVAKKFVGESVKTGGQIGWNQQGTAQGGWYQLDSLGEHGPLASWTEEIDIFSNRFFGLWDAQFSWAPDALDPKTFTVAIGDFNETGSAVGMTKNNLSPLDLKPGSAPVALEIYQFDYLDASGKLFSRDDPAKREFSNALKATPSDKKLGVIVIQLVDENTLKIEKRSGANADSTAKFKGEPLIYKR